MKSLYKSEDWWAVGLGFLIIMLSALNIFSLPKIPSWSVTPIFPLDSLGSLLSLFCILVVLVFVAKFGEVLGDIKQYLVSFILLFISAYVSLLVSKQVAIAAWGLEYVLWALLIGLVLSNILHVPNWLKLKGELFIKTGLVLLGAEILLMNLLSAGVLGLFEVTVGLSIVWYFCYWFARRMGMSKSFSSIMATATSVCGVSAAIAAGGAVKGDPKEVSYTISLVLLFAIPLTILMPLLGRLFGLSQAVTGAWIGGTIDTTPAVVAAGALYGESAMQVASIVKMSQNIMISLVAFLLALWWTLRVERTNEKPSVMEIWDRFPKFVLGFVISCILFSFLPVQATVPIVNMTKNIRGWLFSIAFVGIGLNTDFRELIKMGGGKPLIVFLAATVFDLVVSLALAYVFFGGVLSSL